MLRGIGQSALLFAMCFAGEVVTFDNNWGQNPLFNVVSETPVGLELIFSMHEMVIEEQVIDGIPMKSYGIPGIFLADEGVPNLTGASRYVAIPQGARAHVTIVNSRADILHGVDVAPAPNFPFENDDRPLDYEKNLAIYGKNEYYPSSPVTLSDKKKIRGVDVVLVCVVPFQYNPVTKELIVYKDLHIRVDFVGGNGQFGENRLRSRFWEPVLKNHLLNYSSLPLIDFYSPARTERQTGYEYIIIVPDDPVFEAWGDTIKRFRKEQGISCETYTLSEVGGSSSSAIENFLNMAYTTWDPAPAAFLLLSDYPSSGDVYGITSPLWNSYCRSDNIYADVDGDDLPDMHHARICAQTADQLGTMVNKFLSYERNPYTASNFFDEPLVACGWQDDRWFQLASEVVRGFLEYELGKSPVRQYNIYSGNPVPGGAWSTRGGTTPVVEYWNSYGYIPLTNPGGSTYWDNGSAAGINAALNSGSFFVQHRDHGSTSGWGEPDYGLNDLNNLTNSMFTFVNSTNCLTGQYDNPSEVFAEKFHRINYGCWGINAASDVSYSFVNDTYIWGMWDCLYSYFDPGYPALDLTGYDDLRPCMAMTSGKYYLHAMWFPDSVQGVSGYRVYTDHLFHHHGDVFTTLYSEIPQNLSVTHEATMIAGVATFNVSSDDSSILCLSVGGEIIGVAEGTGSPVPIGIPPQTPGTTVKLVATKANYYRYEADILVVSSNYPYVMYTACVIDDNTGNNNGIVNPGETIDFGVWAKNVGTGTAQDVYGLLSESDPYVMLTADSSWYGNIPEDDSALSSPPYGFVVAPDCPDGHSIDFTLEFHDVNDSVFMSYPSLTVYAPVLTFQGVTVEGGNGNGILEPGETADLIVTLGNEGGAQASGVTTTLITSSPYVTINDSSSDFGTIDTNSTASNAGDPYNVSVELTVPYGSDVEFQIAVSAGSYIDTLDFSVIIGELVPSDTGLYYAYYSSGPHAQSPIFAWMAIDTSQTSYPGTSLDLSDDAVAHVSLPFTFRYYGVDYSEITISSNGWISFTYETSSGITNYPIPHTNGPSAMVAGIWDDLDPGNTGQPSDIYYYYDASNHRFIVEYFMVEHFSSGYHETFEIILYDPVYYPTPTGDGEIIVQYLVTLQQDDVTLGIENGSETIGIQYFYEGTYHELADPLTDEFAIKYTTVPPGFVGVEENNTFTPVPKATMLDRMFPNPAVKGMNIHFQLASRSLVEMLVYDAAGRLIRILSNSQHEPGYYTTLWDARDDRGRTVSAGIYFVYFSTDNYQRVDKAVILK